MRPLEISVKATARDVATLSRVLQRVTGDESRGPAEKKEIADHLRSAISLLVKWTEEEPRKNGNGGGRKEKPRSEKAGLRAGG